jgi:2-polyprenyl-3-methyl-5-hydroxy-6-metoxy-1,4-benzoquinol methylase
MPMEEDIALAYQGYYTHQGEDATRNLGKSLYQLLRGAVSRVTGLINEQRMIHTRYLGDQIPGKLLEIGCGSGDYMKNMKSLGWIVEGVEIDPVACRYARDVNLLTVHEGTVESAACPDNCFDAIVMYHVIEHIYDPVGLLKECHRIVKPGGRVIVITPNIESWGCSKFQENWRGLEPPRHIHIFSPRTMNKTAKLAGLQAVSVTTTPANADYMIAASINLMNLNTLIWRNIYEVNKSNFGFLKQIVRNAKSLIYQLREYRLWKKDPNVGEEVVLICQKER